MSPLESLLLLPMLFVLEFDKARTLIDYLRVLLTEKPLEIRQPCPLLLKALQALENA